MGKVGNFLKLSLAALIGFLTGVIGYSLIAFVIIRIVPEGGGWILIWAIIAFPFIALPLGIMLAIVAVAFEKNKIDKITSSVERKFNNVTLIVIIIILVASMIIAVVSFTKWIEKTIPPKDLIHCSSADDCIIVKSDASYECYTSINKMYQNWWEGRYKETRIKNCTNFPEVTGVKCEYNICREITEETST